MENGDQRSAFAKMKSEYSADNEKIVVGWVKFTSLAHDSPFRAHYEWADDAVLDVVLSDGKRGFELVKALLDRADNDHLIANLAAGPLETLLSTHGETIISDVEAESVANERFKFLLGGVWKGGMSDDVWERIQKIERPSW